ncbi:iron chaperone [Streptomyces sp. NPDC051018]|uniref:iron chaperone n=1 Tax=Streptomyces sp. NPDC051018 TaxID=3365639 RepID=UPI0037969696
MKSTKPSAGNSGPADEQYAGFSAEERAAMKEHAQEQKKAVARRGSSKAEKESAAERDVLAKIAEMPEADRVLAERIHDIVKSAAPGLKSKLWYGMPAYTKDGKVLCHFQSAEKFKTRYASLGFSDEATLDDGAMWPVAYGLRELTADDEKRIRALIEKAAG